MPNTEKKLATLPVIRVGERLEVALMREAAKDSRPLSDYIRLVLTRHCFGHAVSVEEDSAFGQLDGALQSNARRPAE